MEKQVDNRQIQMHRMGISVLRVGHKQMTISVFNQLYETEPFDTNFNITAELWGKVNRDGNYLVFKTPKGIRKYNISSFKRPLKANDFETSIGKAIAKKERSFELEHMRNKLHDFYLFEDHDNKFVFKLFQSLSSDHYEVRHTDYQKLSKALYGNFKDQILQEYHLGLERLKRRNELVDVFDQLPQLFIAV